MALVRSMYAALVPASGHTDSIAHEKITRSKPHELPLTYCLSKCESALTRPENDAEQRVWALVAPRGEGAHRVVQ
jgi:hypothetical protein